MNPLDQTLTELAASLRKCEISSRELTQACLDRIAALEPSLHAFLHVDAENALKQADEIDRRWAVDGGRKKPLAGVPIAVKDILMVEGMPATCGSKILEGFIPPHTATAVKRLQEAGAIVIGKTNTDEFAMGSSTENSAYGVTHNPWDLSRVPGGSSGGSAAAVAARVVPVALGTDTGGSIRQPASFCGVTGIKPTYGRISRYGLAAYGSSFDSVGALGRSVEDVALLFEIMTGKDTLDATTIEEPVGAALVAVHYHGQGQALPLRGMKIGVPQEYFVKGIQAEVEGAVRTAIQTLETLGAEILPVSLPHTEYALAVYYILASSEASANLARYDGIRYGPRVEGESLDDLYLKTRGGKFGAEVERRIMLGTYALSAGYYEAYYGQAQKARRLIRQDFEEAFERVDAIAAPIAPTTAFKIGSHGDDPLAMYLEDVLTLPANLAGVPGLALPVGFDEAGLSVGMQLMGAHFHEEILFQMGQAYQQVTDWHKKKPTVDGGR